MVGIVGGTASGAARKTGHTVSLALTGTMMVCLSIYHFYHARKNRFGTNWQQYGPFYLTVIATILVCLDPLRHVLQDTNVWTSPSSYEYKNGCNSETLKCMSVTGGLITIGATYTGFLLLAIAVGWNANIMDKFQELKVKWRELRSEPNDSQQPLL